jgi:predicted CoA-binding protein
MARQVAGVPPGQGQTSGVARLEFCTNSQKIEYQCQAGLAGCEPPPMNHDAYDDNYIRSILNGVKCIAMVGASPVNIRPSYFAFKYLAQRGYDMIPVNPGHVGKSLLGKPFVASLLDIRRTVDMVDIFRNSSHIMPAVEEALRMVPLPKVIWMQLGARDDAAAEKAEAAGLKVVMNRCPKIEYGRLSSEISWMGVNSRTLSSKRAPLPTQGVQQLSLGRTSVGGGQTAASDRATKNRNDRA